MTRIPVLVKNRETSQAILRSGCEDFQVFAVSRGRIVTKRGIGGMRPFLFSLWYSLLVLLRLLVDGTYLISIIFFTIIELDTLKLPASFVHRPKFRSGALLTASEQSSRSRVPVYNQPYSYQIPCQLRIGESQRELVNSRRRVSGKVDGGVVICGQL